MVFANIVPAPATDGVLYDLAAALPAIEGDLFSTGGQSLDPAPVSWGQAAVAVVSLSIRGNVASHTSYIVMQTDLGDGVWIDVAWCTWTGLTTAVFCLSSAGVGSANAFQQRVSGTPPSPGLGSNAFCLGGRIRFVGKSSVTAGSSSSSSSGPGTTPGVLCTIRFKLLGLR